MYVDNRRHFEKLVHFPCMNYNHCQFEIIEYHDPITISFTYFLRKEFAQQYRIQIEMNLMIALTRQPY